MINSSNNEGHFCLKLGQMEFVVSTTLYGGYMYFKEGWKNFVEDGQLKEGNILFFTNREWEFKYSDLCDC